MLTPFQAQLYAFGVDVFRLCVWLVILAVIFVPLERLFALHPGKVFRASIATDLGYYFLSSLLPGIVLAVPLSLVAWAAHRVVPFTLLDAIAHAPLWLRLAAAFIIGETGFYWGHRMSHEIPFLWRFHAIHHSPEHMDWLVNTRAHPVDMVFTRLCGLVPLYALGLGGPLAQATGSGLIPVLVVLAGTVWGFFIHSNVKWRLGPLEHVVATPAFHHWHHTRTEMINRNYSSTLPWLDRLFGTYHLPRAQWPAQYGTDTPVPDRLHRQLLHPVTARE